jgi:hypothetical protein
MLLYWVVNEKTMGRRPSLEIGDTLNGFEVVNLLPPGKTGKPRKYLVKCPQCLSEATMMVQNIRKSNSCGCLKRDSHSWKRKGALSMPWKLPEGEASFNSLFYRYKKSAEKRKIEFLLNKLQFRDMVTQPCHYCGDCCSSKNLNTVRYNGVFSYTGIYRKENNKGYTPSNSIPCCKTCNFMKLDHDYDFFILHLKKILINLNNEKN